MAQPPNSSDTSTIEPSGEAVHDLGGRDGFGPVPVDDDAIFHSDWERRAFAVTQLAQRVSSFNTDAFRHGIEREDPATYLSATYFEKWIRNAERMLVEGGVITADAVPAQIAGRAATGTAERTTDATPPTSRHYTREVDQPPRFSVGDRVRVRNEPPSGGHTRLPGYARGRTGTVVMANGGWIYPDTHAHGAGDQPTWLYAVEFDSNDLWPSPEASHRVIVDLFEPYLLPAGAADPSVPTR